MTNERFLNAAEARAHLLRGLPKIEQTITCAGVNTPLLSCGDGPPLLVLHGPGEFAARWYRVIPKLGERFQVLVPDLPGHGNSLVPGGRLDAQRVLEWLRDLISQTCRQPPVLVGHILGGAIGARFAAAHPNQLSLLILVDSLGLFRFRPSAGFAFSLFRFMIRPSAANYERFMTRCEHDSDKLSAEMGSDWEALRVCALETAQNPASKNAMQTLMKEVGIPRIAPRDLQSISVPTKLIWGEHDQANRLKDARVVSERYGWPLHVIPDTADDAPLEQPDAFVRAVTAAEEVLSATRSASGASL